MDIRCTIEGADELNAKIAELKRGARGNAALQAVYAGGLVVEKHAKSNIHEVFSSKQTGGLSNSVKTAAMLQGDGAMAVVNPIKVYANIQEMGGTIKPVRAQFLKFQIDGHWFQKKSVTLPARPYLRPALEDNQGEILNAMSSVISQWLATSKMNIFERAIDRIGGLFRK